MKRILLVSNDPGIVKKISQKIKKTADYYVITVVTQFEDLLKELKTKKHFQAVISSNTLDDLPIEALLSIYSVNNLKHIVVIVNESVNDGIYHSILASGVTDCISLTELRRLPTVLRTIHYIESLQQNIVNAEIKCKDFFQNSLLPKFVFNEATLQIYSVNNAAMLLYGYTESEFLQLTLLDLHPKEALSSLCNTLQELYDSKCDYVNDNIVQITKGGDPIFVELYSKSILQNGIACRMLEVQNITTRKTAEIALYKDFIKLSDIVNAFPAVMYQYCVSLEGTANFSYVSPQGKELFDLPVKASEWQLHKHIPIEELDHFLQSIQLAITHKIDWQYEGKIYVPNLGTYKWFFAHACLTIKGDDLVYNGILFDITNTKNTENHQLKSSKLLEDFLFALSHKIRKPLANITGLVDLLENENNTNCEVTEVLQFIKEASVELDGCIAQLNQQLFINRNTLSIAS